jgi:hypothetical protein
MPHRSPKASSKYISHGRFVAHKAGWQRRTRARESHGRAHARNMSWGNELRRHTSMTGALRYRDAPASAADWPRPACALVRRPGPRACVCVLSTRARTGHTPTPCSHFGMGHAGRRGLSAPCHCGSESALFGIRRSEVRQSLTPLAGLAAVKNGVGHPRKAVRVKRDNPTSTSCGHRGTTTRAYRAMLGREVTRQRRSKDSGRCPRDSEL